MTWYTFRTSLCLSIVHVFILLIIQHIGMYTYNIQIYKCIMHIDGWSITLVFAELEESMTIWALIINPIKGKGPAVACSACVFPTQCLYAYSGSPRHWHPDVWIETTIPLTMIIYWEAQTSINNHAVNIPHATTWQLTYQDVYLSNNQQYPTLLDNQTSNSNYSILTLPSSAATSNYQQQPIH